MTRFVLAIALAPCAGCGSDSEEPSGAGGAGACTDAGTPSGNVPCGPPAEGALIVNVSAGPSCPSTGHVASIGSPPPTASETGGLVVEGVDGSVACSVKGSGTFAINATISTQAVSFSVTGGTLDAGGTGTGQIAFEDQMIDPVSSDCTLAVNEGSLAVEPGRVWAKFDCPALSDGTSECAASGYFVFENCEE